MTTETPGYKISIWHCSAFQIISVKTRGYRHKYHSTLLSLELLLQLQTIVTNVLRLSFLDDYLFKFAYSTFSTIYIKMSTTKTSTTRT